MKPLLSVTLTQGTWQALYALTLNAALESLEAHSPSDPTAYDVMQKIIPVLSIAAGSHDELAEVEAEIREQHGLFVSEAVLDTGRWAAVTRVDRKSAGAVLATRLHSHLAPPTTLP